MNKKCTEDKVARRIVALTIIAMLSVYIAVLINHFTS